MMKMLRATRVEPTTFGAQMAFGRVVQPLGWFGLGALTAGAAAWALLRSGRWPSTDEEPDAQEPDVLLDVTELEVDKINLEVERLRAHVSILAELANLLSLSVGVDARLARVQLEIEGVEAKVLLKARLRHVRAILEKSLDTIGEHPEILRILARSLSRLVREGLGETLGTLGAVLEGLEVGDTVDEMLKERLEEVRDALEEILERSERGVEGAAKRELGEGPVSDTAAPSAPESRGDDAS